MAYIGLFHPSVIALIRKHGQMSSQMEAVARGIVEQAIDDELQDKRLELSYGTFKRFEEKVDMPAGHYGALRGLNHLAGEDLNVAGTPHLNPSTYLLIGMALGYNVHHGDFTFRYEEVERNGMAFWFNICSEDPRLRNLQLYLIESELIQAIGRARLLDNDCTVRVFSNLPIVGASFHDLRKLTDE